MDQPTNQSSPSSFSSSPQGEELKIPPSQHQSPQSSDDEEEEDPPLEFHEHASTSSFNNEHEDIESSYVPPRKNSKKSFNEVQTHMKKFVTLGAIKTVAVLEDLSKPKLNGLHKVCAKDEMWNYSLDRCIDEYIQGAALNISPTNMFLISTAILAVGVYSSNMKHEEKEEEFIDD